jgi:hypothetical protein
MAKVPYTMQVDDEVLAIGKTLVGAAKDIQAKASVAQDFGDAVANLSGGLANLANLASDVKANPDNRAYLAAALEQTVDAFMNPAPAVATA